MTYKHGNWYCKPANEAEAREIVERAVASGAAKIMIPSSFGGSQYHITWYKGGWGVHNGGTNCYAPNSSVTKYTIDQLRELFPLPGERSSTDWNGEGLPPVGVECLVRDDLLAPEEYKHFCGKAVEVVAHTTRLDGIELAVFKCNDDEGFCDFHGLVAGCFVPLRTEREKWIEDAVKIHSAHQWTAESFAESLYDAMKSGELKAPE